MKLPLPLCRWLWQQDWIGLAQKKSVYRVLSNAGEAPDAPFETQFFRLRYQGNLNNGIEFALYYYGAFEKPLLFFLRDVFQQLEKNRGRTGSFCDIGANIGQHSLFMSPVSYTHLMATWQRATRISQFHASLAEPDGHPDHRGPATPAVSDSTAE